MVAKILQLTFGGLTMGSIYALIALAFSLLFSGLGIINFATGEFAMVGAYFGLIALKTLGLPYPIAVPITLAAMFGFGILFGLVLVRPFVKGVALMEKALNPILMATAAAGILLTQSANILARLPEGERFPSVFGKEAIPLGPIQVIPQNLWTIALSVVLMVAFFLFLQKTKMGAGMRAIAQDRDTSALMGVQVERLDLWMCGLSGVLGGAAGILISPLFTVSPAMGGIPGLKGFAAAIVGGFGNIPGAIVGGFILGALEGYSAAFISEGYKDAIVLLLLIFFLAFRSHGIFGQQKH